MSFFDLFKATPAPAALTPTAPPPIGNTTNTVEGNSNANSKAAPPAILDTFKDLWTSGENGDDADDDTIESLFDIDPKKIEETVSKIDFAKSIDQDVIRKISEGGEEAQAAFALALNQVAQTVFSQSMLANGVLVKQALTGAQAQFDKRSSNNYKNTAVSDSLSKTNPLLNHPSVEPFIDVIKSRLTKKYPNAPAEEIKSKALQYLDEFAEAVQDPKRKKEVKNSNDVDWDSLMSL